MYTPHENMDKCLHVVEKCGKYGDQTFQKE